MSKQTVCIVYGFSEGAWHGRRLRALLRKNGFEIVTDATKADILFCHSGGCFYIPRLKPRQAAVLVGPPYWPGKSIIVAFLQKVWRDMKYCFTHNQRLYFFRKTFWNIAYTIVHPKRNFEIASYAREHNFYAALHDYNVAIVRNQDDAFCSPDIVKLMLPYKPFLYFEEFGQHDDCWSNPMPYLKIIKLIAN